MRSQRGFRDSAAAWIKKNAVFSIALLVAAATAFAVPPDSAYPGYFDWKTLTCLFCVLSVVCALKNINFFYILARKTVEFFKTARICITALVYITFIGSMLIANDMALLTFLPLGYFVLSSTGKEKYMAFTFVMQNIAANLGGMLTPFGNPQNLYLYSYFSIPTGEFMRIMFPPFAAAVVLITACCLFFVKNEPLVLKGDDAVLNFRRAAVYLTLFVFSILCVLRIIPYQWGLIVPAAILLHDRKAMTMVDYPLLGTFAAFFVLSGNLSRMDAVRDFMTGLLEINTLFFSTLSCQFISNVPSAILLSRFTLNYPELLVGVNIGGCGTLIASLASLITFREYVSHNPGQTRHYMAVFSAFNFGFLIFLLIFMTVLMRG